MVETRVGVEWGAGSGWRRTETVAGLADLIRGFHKAVAQAPAKRAKKASQFVAPCFLCFGKRKKQKKGHNNEKRKASRSVPE